MISMKYVPSICETSAFPLNSQREHLRMNELKVSEIDEENDCFSRNANTCISGLWQ